jgi:hypothetical protein
MIEKDYGGVDRLVKSRAVEQAGGTWTGRVGGGKQVGSLV